MQPRCRCGRDTVPYRMHSSNLLEAIAPLGLAVGFLNVLFAGGIAYALRRRGAMTVLLAIAGLVGILGVIFATGYVLAALSVLSST